MIQKATSGLTALLLLWGCGPGASRDATDGGGDVIGDITLSIEPATMDITLTRGQPEQVVYTVTATHEDGRTEDVTDRVSFTLDRGLLGQLDGGVLTLSGAAAGVGHVTATLAGASANASLTVRVEGVRATPDAPAGAADIFDDGAIDSPGQAPTIVYPADGTMFPPNIGTFEVHYQDAGGNDVYEIVLSSEYLDLRVHAGPGWALLDSDEWKLVAATHAGGAVSLSVRGASTAAPELVGTSETFTIEVASQDVAGGIYYWSVTDRGIYRHDFGKPEQDPEPYFLPADAGEPCIGCHSLSRDGTRMGVHLWRGQYDVGSYILDVASKQPLAAPQPWGIAAFHPDSELMLTSDFGELQLRSTDGQLMETVPDAYYAVHQDWSPTGEHIVWTRPGDPATPREGGVDNNEFLFWRGSIYTQAFDEATQSFGAPSLLVPPNGQTQYFPSFSPDGTWITFVRSTGLGHDDPNARVWAVPVDGSQAPIELAAANHGDGNLHNSWPRFAPFMQTTGGDDPEPVFWLTFSSVRAFGNRIEHGARAQLWMAPFFPARAAAGQDPSRPAFRLPFQDLATSNHVAQWTETVVPVD